MSSIKKKNLAVFVSSTGSTFKAIHQATLTGVVPGTLVVAVTDKHESGGAKYARENGIPVIIYYPKTDDEAGAGLSPADLHTALSKYNVEYIVLAGFYKKVASETVQAYPKRILNVHPSLLPAFGGPGYFGLAVHKAVLASGVRYTGVTVHFVDENFETGPIVAQTVLPVNLNETAEELEHRVLPLEHKLYVEVIAAVCEDRIVWREDGIPLIRSKDNPNQLT